MHTDDWRCDQYRWFQNGRKKIPKNDPVLVKTYFVCVNTNGKFKRHAYSQIGDAHKTLIHYLGDHTTAIDFPHGNSKQNERVHVRTCPSVLRSITNVDAPSNIYKKEITKNDCLPEHQPVLKPRNVKQVSNMQSNNRQKCRVSHDALYNIHELAYDLDGFIAKIITYPDLVIVCGSPLMVAELGKVLQLSTTSTQLLSYDTTFKLGDFYLSPLLFCHSAFIESPVLPALFLNRKVFMKNL